MQDVIKRLKLIGKEIVNFATDILCPIISLVLVILETFGLPVSVLAVIKKVEYILFYICGTRGDIIHENHTSARG